jgi:hypothetical protein
MFQIEAADFIGTCVLCGVITFKYNCEQTPYTQNFITPLRKVALNTRRQKIDKV